MATTTLSLPQAYMHALTLQKQGQDAQAAQIYQMIMQKAPRDTSAALQLARLLLKANQIDQAHKTLASRYEWAKSNFEYLYLLGALSLQLRQLDLALEAAHSACSQQEESAQALNLLGSVHMERSEFSEAIKAFSNAISRDQNFADPHNNLAWAYRATGESRSAIDHFAKAYKLEPKATEALSGLLMLKRFERVDQDISEAERVLDSSTLSRSARTELHFALGKAYEDCKLYDLAYSHFEQGNSTWRSGLNYSTDIDRRLFDSLRNADYGNGESPSTSKCASESSTVDNTPIPIFVLGMPRSSTSLIEQILASHSEVTGAGELPLLNDLLMSGADFVWSPERRDDIRQRYLTHLSAVANGKAYVVDKMPQNFRFIGVISSCFPEAKIIHCERDPRDNCLSLYKHHFPMTQHDYAYKSDELVAYHQLYRELMQHWTKQEAISIFPASYEHLIEHFEEDVRALLQHIGLEFEPACLEFQKTKRAIRTASSEQVRKGLYKSGAGQWRNYETHLRDLFEALPSHA